MKRKRNRLFFAVGELFCLLCFVALAVPVGHLYRIRIIMPALIWGLCLCFCAVLFLLWLAVFWPWKHKRAENLSIVLALVLSFHISCHLLMQAVYWNNMFELGFVPDTATAARYGLCFLFCTSALLGLGIWGFFLHRSSKPEQT